MTIQSAADRMIRTLVLSIGIGSVLFTILGLAAIVGQHSFLIPVYSFTAVAVFCGIPPAMAALSFTAPIRVLRVLAGVHAAGTLVLLILWIPAMTDQNALVGGALPWIISTITVAAVEAAIAVPFVFAWSYMVVIAVVSGAIRFITYGSADASQAIQDAIMIVLISGFLMALVQLTLLAGRQQDTVAALAQEAATTAATAINRDRQRNRSRGLTREDVAATLRAAMQNTPDYREFARGRAVQTLQRMDTVTSAVQSVASLPISEFDVQLRTAAVAQGVSYASSIVDPADPMAVPLDVAEAFNDALIEAMRNSVQHADWRNDRVVHRTVRAHRDGRAISVVIKDDGRGFNPRRIGLDRLGMQLNIVQRLESVSGGSAAVVSARGKGTTVTIEWNGQGA